MNRTRISVWGLVVAFGIVALGLPAALAGLFGTLRQLDSINSDVAVVRNAQLDAADLAHLQRDDEIALRGYAATHGRVFLDADRRTSAELARAARDLHDRLTAISEGTSAIPALDEAVESYARWRDAFAIPLLAGGRPPAQPAQTFAARYADDARVIEDALLLSYHQLLAKRGGAIRHASEIGYAAIAAVAFELLVFAVLFTRLRYELDRERAVTETLQRSFASAVTSDPRLDVATVYMSATRGAKVGGDVYDVFRIDEHRTLFTIADVSGKGIAAAVDTTFVKYSLRAFASEFADIAVVTARFNTLYADAQKPPESFVVLFTGIFDHVTGRLTYVNAGHEAAFVRRSGVVEQLGATDAIVGLERTVAFHAQSVPLGPDDVLFLATDGLTEARDPGGRFLGAAAVGEWLRDSPAPTPRALVRDIAERLRHFTRTNINDDLAILAIAPTAAG